MPISDSAGYEFIAAQLANQRGEMTSDEFMDAATRIVNDVRSSEDVFALAVRLSTVATGCLNVAARKLGRDPSELLQDAATWYAGGDDDSGAEGEDPH